MDMIQRLHIILPGDQARDEEFVRAIVNKTIRDYSLRFNHLTSKESWSRQHSDISMEEYFEKLKNEKNVYDWNGVLQVGTVDPALIRLSTKFSCYSRIVESQTTGRVFLDHVSYFLWYECPLTDENYEIFRTTFVNIYPIVKKR